MISAERVRLLLDVARRLDKTCHAHIFHLQLELHKKDMEIMELKERLNRYQVSLNASIASFNMVETTTASF